MGVRGMARAGLIGMAATLGLAATGRAAEPGDARHYDVVLGTQTFGAAYQFTAQPKLVETAQAIAALGSPIIKFALEPQGPAQAAWSLADIAARDPVVKSVLDMDFAYQLLWAYPPATKPHLFAPDTLDAEYRQLHDLARYLLTTYSGTGKSFYLGNWEGDWHLTAMGHREPSARDIARMTDWVAIRQKAVADARRETPHQGVQVWYYVEVNQVVAAQQGRQRLANAVLPAVDVDYVSYSAYDSLSDQPEARLLQSLDYLQSQLRPRPDIPGRRVFIGEFGFPAARYSPEQQDALSRQVMRAGLRWGCPFVLYWEMYNNEVADGAQRGFWLIDDRGRKQPLYGSLQRYYKSAGAFLDRFRAANGRLPTQMEFDGQAADWIR